MKAARDDPKALLKLCDELRDDVLPFAGIRLEDTSSGTVWKLARKEDLIAEREEKMRVAKEKEEMKKKMAEEKARKEKEKEEKAKESYKGIETVKEEDEEEDWRVCYKQGNAIERTGGRHRAASP